MAAKFFAIFAVIISTSCCLGGVVPAAYAVPAAYSVPYASSYSAHVVNHAVAAPFVTAPVAAYSAGPVAAYSAAPLAAYSTLPVAAAYSAAPVVALK